MTETRQELEAAPDCPESIKANEESYIAGIKSLAKHFLRGLDDWTDFDRTKDWKESELGDVLYGRTQDKIPEPLKSQLTGNQVGMAAHLAYQAFITS